jgi:hypothetical protein
VIEKLIFWAQALDNSSPDHIDEHGEELSSTDTVRRQEVVSLVSEVIKRGARIFDQEGVRLTEDGRSFVVEVPSTKADRIGRSAPIICYGDYDSTVDEMFGATVAENIESFAHRIGRTILPEHCVRTRDSFGVLKKKYSMRRLLRLALVAALVLSLLAIGYRLAFWGP